MIFMCCIRLDPPENVLPRSYAHSADGVQAIHVAHAARRAAAGVDGQSVGAYDLLSLVAPAVVARVEILLLLGGQHVEHEELLTPKFPAERALDLGGGSLLGTGGGRKIAGFRIHVSENYAVCA